MPSSDQLQLLVLRPLNVGQPMTIFSFPSHITHRVLMSWLELDGKFPSMN